MSREWCEDHERDSLLIPATSRNKNLQHEKLGKGRPQPRPQGFSPPIFWGKSPGDEVGKASLKKTGVITLKWLLEVYCRQLISNTDKSFKEKKQW